MRRQSRLIFGFVLVTAGLALAGFALFPADFSSASDNNLASVFQVYEKLGPFVAAVSPDSQSCAINGAYPDKNCTTGAVFSDITREDVCVSGYTKTVRSVSVATKRKIYQEYNIAYPQPTGTYEADHFIPLELGGTNDTANLFPEAAEPTPGFREKDVVENFLHDEVCGGRVSLSAAQWAIATDWVEVYKNIPAETVKSIKGRYSK